MIKWLFTFMFCCSMHAQVVIKGATLRGGTLSSPTIINLQSVDTFLDFHSQTNDFGMKYNTNLLTSDVWGNPGNWSPSSEGTINASVFTNVVSENVLFTTPIQTPDGHIATGTGTNWVREDLTEAANGSCIMGYNFSGASLVSASGYFIITNISDPLAANSRDLYQWFGNPYAIAQFNIADGNIGTYGSQVRSGVHTAMTGATPSIVLGVPTNKVVRFELVQHLTNGIAFASFYTNNILVFSSIGYGIPYADLQTFFKYEAGYIYTAGVTGQVYRSGVYLSYGSHVNTNRSPWTPNTPSSLAANQSGSGIATAAWTDSNFMLNSNLVSYSNSTEEVTTWCQPQSNSVVTTGLTAGHDYDVRATAYYINNVKSTPAFTTLSITNTGSTTNTWLTSNPSGSVASLGGTAGAKFTVGVNDIDVTDLGCWKTATSYGPTHTITLRDASCNSLGSVSVNFTTTVALTYGFGNLTTPITLTHGTTYIIDVNGLSDDMIAIGTATADSAASKVDSTFGSCQLQGVAGTVGGVINFKYVSH